MTSPAEKLAAKKRRKLPTRSHPAGPMKCLLLKNRRELGLSTRDVATALPMSVAGYNRIERGHDPMLSTARKLAAFFGKTVEEIWP